MKLIQGYTRYSEELGTYTIPAYVYNLSVYRINNTKGIFRSMVSVTFILSRIKGKFFIKVPK